jgi:hypothetical protein
MSIIYDFTQPYAGGTATTLLTVTGSGPATNYIMKIFGLSDDTTNAALQSVDASYALTWNGSGFTGPNTIGYSPPLSFAWDLSSNPAAFNFTPVEAAPGGSFGVYAILMMANTNSPATFSN